MVDGCRFYQRYDMLKATRLTSQAGENKIEHGGIFLSVKLIPYIRVVGRRERVSGPKQPKPGLSSVLLSWRGLDKFVRR
jgi:membrane protein YdbS with pleckstrin-like domain